jgi:hypothetical protein
MLLQWSERDLLARRNSSGFSVLLIYICLCFKFSLCYGWYLW